MFLCFTAHRFEVFIQPLFEKIVFNIQLLLTSYIHGVYTQIWNGSGKVRYKGWWLLSLFSVTVLLRTDAGHVWEDNVNVDFQFVSSWCVHIQLRMNLWGANNMFIVNRRIFVNTRPHSSEKIWLKRQEFQKNVALYYPIPEIMYNYCVHQVRMVTLLNPYRF